MSFVKEEAIIDDLESITKKDAIGEIVAKLVSTGAIDREHEASIVAAILDREGLGTTGIGRGVAVPHTMHQSVNDVVGAMAHSTRGINFESIDSKPVHHIFLLVCPSDRPTEQLEALEHIARRLRRFRAD